MDVNPDSGSLDNPSLLQIIIFVLLRKMYHEDVNKNDKNNKKNNDKVCTSCNININLRREREKEPNIIAGIMNWEFVS